jgi:hypothetical protein
VAYSPVYSSPFIVYTPATPNEEFEVPAGYVADIREIDMYTSLGGGKLIVAFGDPVSGWYCNFASLYVAGVATSAQWTGHVVVPAGNIIALDVAALGVDDCAYVGGYLLTVVAP